MAKEKSEVKKRGRPLKAERPPMTDNEKYLRGFVDAQPLHLIGGSYMLVVPLLWLQVFCEIIDGRYWVKRSGDSNTLTIKPVTQADLEEAKAQCHIVDDKERV